MPEILIPSATVLFCEDGGAQGSYTFTTQGGGTRRHLITGLPSGRRYRVGAAETELTGVTSQGGTLVFETELKTPWKFTVTLE